MLGSRGKKKIYTFTNRESWRVKDIIDHGKTRSSRYFTILNLRALWQRPERRLFYIITAKRDFTFPEKSQNCGEKELVNIKAVSRDGRQRQSRAFIEELLDGISGFSDLCADNEFRSGH